MNAFETDADELGVTRRRHREWELDLLLAHELASASPAAALLWQAAGQVPPPAPVAVVPQATRVDGRTTDLEAIASDGRALLLENKAAGGSYELRQPESYAEHCAGRAAWAITVAPQSFLTANLSPLFDGAAAVEDLADALEREADTLPTTGDPHIEELRSSYRYRAETLRRYAQDPGYTGNPDDDVRSLGNLYRTLLPTITDGRLTLAATAIQNAATTFASIGGSWFSRREVIHKMDKGVIDFACRGWTVADLVDRAAGLPAGERIPSGWTPAKPDTGKTTVLRFQVEPFIPKVVEPADAERIITDVGAALLALDDWLGAGGRVVIDTPPAAR